MYEQNLKKNFVVEYIAEYNKKLFLTFVQCFIYRVLNFQKIQPISVKNDKTSLLQLCAK
jgi:hypothetical protein